MIYTPGLNGARQSPNDCLITVDLDDLRHPRVWFRLLRRVERWVAFVCGTISSFSGVGLHSIQDSRCFLTSTAKRSPSLCSASLGTGKTTTTFREQLGSLPVQDDFNALMPGGEVQDVRGRLLREDVRARSPMMNRRSINATAAKDAWLENTLRGLPT